MIHMTAAELVRVVGGELHGDPSTMVTGPAIVDSRQVAAGCLFVAMVGEHVDGHDYVDAAVKSGAAVTLSQRPVSGTCIVVDEPMTALAQLARWTVLELRRHGQLTVVALTGSQGKTSVKDMAAQIFESDGPTVAPEGSFNNELGVPLTILRATTETRWLVLEMGARGVGHISYLCSIASPDVAAVLNVGTAHLGEFGSIDTIARAKSEIISALGDDGIAVLNADDPRVLAMKNLTTGPVVTFGYGGDVSLLAEPRLDEKGHAQVQLGFHQEQWQVTIPQIGFHHGINAAAAFAIAVAAGVEPRVAATALAHAAGRSAMRMEASRTSQGTLILNDAYNANPESMKAGLETLAALAPARSIAVLGTMLELGGDSHVQHRLIGQRAADLGVDLVVVIGESARGIAEGAGERAVFCESLEDATKMLRASLRPSDTVLVKASRSIKLEKLVAALMAA